MKLFRWQRQSLTPEERKTQNKQRFFGLLTGILLAVSFPPVPFPFTLLIFAGFIPYFLVLDKKEKLIDINRFTYLTFFVFNIFTIYWVGGWGAETDPFLMIAGILLLFINPVFFLIPSTLFYFARQFFNKKIAFLLFPFFWVTYEYAYMITDASFPWLTLGNGLAYFNLFIQIADIVGALGLSMLIVYINLSLYFLIKKYIEVKSINVPAIVSSLLLLFIPIIYGLITYSTYKIPEKKIKVGLIQPNLNPWDKWSGGDLWDIADIYFDMSTEAVKQNAEIIIFPETALPVYLLDGSHRDVVDSIYRFIRNNKIYLLTGMPDFKYYNNKDEAPYDAKYSKAGNFYYTTYNGVLLFSPYTNNIQHYGKMKLVPFGERVPFVDVLPFLGDLIKWQVGLSGWNKGKDTLVFNLINNVNMTQPDTIHLNGLVCFESVYPIFVSRFVEKGADFISVVTNDSWYGNSSGPYQHKEISILRAIENRRSVVRAANGGISTIINPLGQTIEQTKMYTKDIIVGDVPIEAKLTFFSRNPLIIPVISSIISIWIIGMYFLNKLKKLFKM